MIKFTKQTIADAVRDKLRETIYKAAYTGDLIQVSDDFRGCGKTTALIQFAKENNLTVIVAHESIANLFKRDFEYENIISQNTLRGRKRVDVVFDEGVDLTKVVESGMRVVTGFVIEKK